MNKDRLLELAGIPLSESSNAAREIEEAVRNLGDVIATHLDRKAYKGQAGNIVNNIAKNGTVRVDGGDEINWMTTLKSEIKAALQDSEMM